MNIWIKNKGRFIVAQLTDEQLASIAHDFYLSKLNIAEFHKNITYHAI